MFVILCAGKIADSAVPGDIEFKKPSDCTVFCKTETKS